MKKKSKAHLAHEAEAGVAGAIAGAAVGAVAGPPGAITGALIGAAVGAITGTITEQEAASETAEDRKLDDEIGVSSGELGAPNLEHPPAKVGAYSSAAAGSTSSGNDEELAEGPMQSPP